MNSKAKNEINEQDIETVAGGFQCVNGEGIFTDGEKKWLKDQGYRERGGAWKKSGKTYSDQDISFILGVNGNFEGNVTIEK